MQRARGKLFRKYLVVLVLLVGGLLTAASAIELYFSYQESQQVLVKVEREKALAAAELAGVLEGDTQGEKAAVKVNEFIVKGNSEFDGSGFLRRLHHAIGGLLATHRQCDSQGRSLRVSGCSGSVYRTLEVMGLPALLRFDA